MGRAGRLPPLFGIKPSTKIGRKKVQGVGRVWITLEQVFCWCIWAGGLRVESESCFCNKQYAEKDLHALLGRVSP